MGLEKRLERIANHYGYPEDLPSSVSDDARDAIGVIKRLGAEIDKARADLRSYEITFNMMHETKAEQDVLAERRRQKSEEGYDEAYDDRHEDDEMAAAAACYAWPSWSQQGGGHLEDVPDRWPWDRRWWKPGGRRRMLVKAAALILAEIERLDRAAAKRADA